MRYVFVWARYTCPEHEPIETGEYLEDDVRLFGKTAALVEMEYAVYSDLDLDEFDDD